MANPSSSLQRAFAFFHSQGRTLTEGTQNVFESQYSSGHVLFPDDVGGERPPLASTQAEADANVIARPDLLTKYTTQLLTEVPGSNQQAWYINDGGTWIRPIILPPNVPDPVTNFPSVGYEPTLYRNDGTTQIFPTEGVWAIDPFQGIIWFEAGFTPSDQGYGVPRLTCYAYTGPTLQSVLDNIGTPSGDPIKRGTTAQRTALGPLLVPIDNNGHPFYDTDLDQLFNWFEGEWVLPTYTPATTGSDNVKIWRGDDTAVLPGAYGGGDMWIDTTGGKFTLRMCKVGVITNTMADWQVVGKQNG